MQGSVKALTTALSNNTRKRQNMQSYKIQKKNLHRFHTELGNSIYFSGRKLCLGLAVKALVTD